MVREDTQPWYRQFWPWFIIALPASAVVAGLTTVWISMQTSDSLVVASDDGMQIVAERRINAEQLATEMNLAALIEIDPGTGAIAVAMQSGAVEALPAVLELELSHPAFADRDQVIALHRALPDAAGNPVWSGYFVNIPRGRWYLTLKSGDDWRLAGVWQGETRMTLRPAETRHDNGR
ncbi:MAG: FixH family protein [Gammaproteobacteria bacterium]|nr:FixH family protein [Gammaproteobacteria bacterium]MBU2676194.1 FixH family protein [Gammaproteobacteria bacterium]NNL49930.1 FixH family protein [Woeseiaceae bacterium]